MKCRSGIRSRRQRTSVDSPTAAGPDSTITRPVPTGRPSVLIDSPGLPAGPTRPLAAARLGVPPQAFRPASSSDLRKVELFQQGLALTVAEPAQAARRGDLQLGHDFLRL